jgi:hypothetical protein
MTIFWRRFYILENDVNSVLFSMFLENFNKDNEYVNVRNLESQFWWFSQEL